MTNIFDEIDEELRRDRVAAFWKRHSTKLIALAVILVAGVGAWRFYENRQLEASQQAGARFDAALQLTRDGKTAEAEQALSAIVQDNVRGYRDLARLRAAAEAGRTDAAKGIAAFQAIASDAAVPQELQQLATLRAAMLRLDTEDPKAVMATLEPLASPTAPFRNSARELLGLAALKAGDYEAAGRWFDQIVTDRSAPAALMSRVEVYLAVVRSGPVPPTQ